MVRRGDRLIYVRHLKKSGGVVAFIPTSWPYTQVDAFCPDPLPLPPDGGLTLAGVRFYSYTAECIASLESYGALAPQEEVPVQWRVWPGNIIATRNLILPTLISIYLSRPTTCTQPSPHPRMDPRYATGSRHRSFAFGTPVSGDQHGPVGIVK